MNPRTKNNMGNHRKQLNQHICSYIHNQAEFVSIKLFKIRSLQLKKTSRNHQKAENNKKSCSQQVIDYKKQIYNMVKISNISKIKDKIPVDLSKYSTWERF